MESKIYIGQVGRNKNSNYGYLYGKIIVDEQEHTLYDLREIRDILRAHFNNQKMEWLIYNVEFRGEDGPFNVGDPLYNVLASNLAHRYDVLQKFMEHKDINAICI